MLRPLLKTSFLGVFLLGGAYALYQYEKNRSPEAQLQEQVRQLEQQRQHLLEFVNRLTTERRAAEILVIDQTRTNGRVDSTTLLFVETTRDGQRMPPKFFTIKGNVAHIDSLVIKFEHGFIENNDPLRGHSLVLFHRLFGDHQTPADGFPIDEPGQSPEIYRPDPSLPPAVQAFEAELWRDFWRLAQDPEFRQQKGVRVAQGEGPWMPFNPDYVYTLSIEAAGGLSIVSRPIDPLFREYRNALRRP